MADGNARRWLRWLGAAAELGILLASLAFLVTGEVRALIAWLVIGVLYAIGGFAAVWNGGSVEVAEAESLRSSVRWSWVPPLLAAVTGAASAATALVERGAGTNAPGDTVLIVAASLGVILSWVLLQVGFADVYLVLDLTGKGEDLRFPDGSAPSVLDFLYFSFTLGTSFATSDVEVVSIRARRLVLIHSVLAFFYNALVVAVAFQVLQDIVAR